MCACGCTCAYVCACVFECVSARTCVSTYERVRVGMGECLHAGVGYIGVRVCELRTEVQKPWVFVLFLSDFEPVSLPL